MLWVAHENFDDRERKKAKYTFAIGEKIYLLNASFNNGGFLMSELNPRNYELKEIGVKLNNFVAPHSVYGGSLIVHDGRAYLWHARGQKLYVGWIESDECHWEVAETSGFIPSSRYGNAYCKVNGSLLIHGGFQEEAMIPSGETYSLDLETKIWTRRPTVASQEILAAFMSIHRWEGCAAIGEKRIHVIGSKADTHFTLDLSTNHWSAVQAANTDRLPIVYNVFCACDRLFLYGFPSPDVGAALYRFEEDVNAWAQVHASGGRSPRLSTIYQNTLVMGTRVFFIEGVEGVERLEGDEGAASMSVLELNPKLFDHAASVLLRSEQGKDTIRSALPKYLSHQLVHDKEAPRDEEAELGEGEDRRPHIGLLREIRLLRARHGLDGLEVID
ncbi:hypothetical protein PFISCL1PPCAC_3137 [Pristionchus fissidentatus]|uniref:Uncharacterized protein n=1 Tax=Pristionchus fissidentatus TaxID=1538716 RepID=A0AAV5UX41_9BILA|nr:hypothetical protein PFISCL1PPCAC_3137 [Pristionchus fissidentatus]